MASSLPNRSSVVNKRTVVSIGSQPELLWLREAVLKDAGFEVLTTEDENVALCKIRDDHCGFLLVCYSLSDERRKRVVDGFRQHCPKGKIVEISETPMQRSFFADDFVYGLDGPEALIDALRK